MKSSVYYVSNVNMPIAKDFVHLSARFKIQYKNISELSQQNLDIVKSYLGQIDFSNTVAICYVGESVERINLFNNVNKALSFIVSLSNPPIDFEEIKN